MTARHGAGALRITPQAPAGQWRALLVIALAVGITAFAGAIASADAREFYAQLVKPGWAPAAKVFGPAWTVLYLMMGVSAWLVWRARGSFQAAAVPLGLFFAQLVVNGLWSWLFFRWKLGAVALVDVALLWMLVLATLSHFWAVQRVSAWLLLPYLLWTGFATALTAAVWQLNPTLL
jgi:tryptophan-rich sensory protein